MAESAVRKGAGLTTAIVGVGNIGGALARHLVAGGESVVLAAKDGSRAEALADELGPLARAASVEDAIAGADARAPRMSRRESLIVTASHGGIAPSCRIGACGSWAAGACSDVQIIQFGVPRWPAGMVVAPVSVVTGPGRSARLTAGAMAGRGPG
jgi:hypothetical protein